MSGSAGYFPKTLGLRLRLWGSVPTSACGTDAHNYPATLPKIFLSTIPTEEKHTFKMFNVKRPKKKPLKGLVFSSSSKRKQDESSFEESAGKRARVDESQTITTEVPNGKIAATNNGSHLTNILVLSDTHGKSDLPNNLLNVKIDVVLHCGDLSECGELEDYHQTIALLAVIPASLKLVIAGNHDLTLDQQFWDKNSTATGADLNRQARELWSSKEAQDAGITFLEYGLHEFKLGNGAKLRIFASSATPNSAGVREWAFGHQTGEDVYNPEGKGISYVTYATTRKIEIQNDAQIDVFMTHGPAKYRLHRTRFGGESIGCPHLFRALRRTRPLLHVFGHVHNGYGAEVVRWSGDGKKMLPGDDDGSDDGIEQIERVEGRVSDGVRELEVAGLKAVQRTAFVNAALMGNDGELDNLPWLVRVELSSA